MSENDTKPIVDEPEVVTVNVDKSTLDLIKKRMEDKYNNFWGDVIDDEQKRTIEIADKLSPGKPYQINGKSYTFNFIGMKRWRELAKMKVRGDAMTNPEEQTDLLTEYYTAMLIEIFKMSPEEADMVPPGEARMVCDGAAYKVLHPVPLHPEKLKSGFISDSA